MDELRRYTEQLAEAEAQAAAAISRVDALRKIVEGLQALREPAQTDLFEPPSRPTRTDGDEPSLGPAAPTGFPRGREAVRGVLIETRRAWKIPDLAKEIGRRGWMADVKNRRDAVAATVQRLVKDGEAERIGHGVYRYRLDKLPPLSADSSSQDGGGQSD